MERSKLPVILSHSPPCELADWAKEDAFIHHLTSSKEFLSKLSLNLGLPFSNNIEELCDFSLMSKGELLVHACRTTDARVFWIIIDTYIIDRGSFTEAARECVKRDSPKLLERLLNEDLDVRNLLRDAVAAGNVEAVKILLDRGIKADFHSLYTATLSDNLDIVEILVDYKSEIVDDFDFDFGCDQGLVLRSAEVTRLILETFHRKLSCFISLSETIGYGAPHEVLDLLVEYRFTDYEAILLYAGYGRIDIMAYAIEKGATNVDEALLHFARIGSLNRVTKFLLDNGATQVQEALYEAVQEHGNRITLQLLLRYGAVIDDEVYRLARDRAARGDREIINYLESEDV